VQWLGLLVCLVAAYRLMGTPLQAVAAAVAVASMACGLVAWLTPRESNGRLVTGFQHVCAALGGFFLFVSLAMR
jgi:hypothetical protein